MERQVIVDRGDSSAPAVMTAVLIALALILAFFYFGDRDVINVSTPAVQTESGTSIEGTSVGATAE